MLNIYLYIKLLISNIFECKMENYDHILFILFKLVSFFRIFLCLDHVHQYYNLIILMIVRQSFSIVVIPGKTIKIVNEF